MPYTRNTFIVYPDQFFGRFAEMQRQNTDVFNAASQNGIVQRAVARRGDYSSESFLSELTNGITRRDPTSTADASPIDDVDMEEITSVKLARKLVVQKTIDGWRKIQADQAADDEQLLSFYLGGYVSKAVRVDWLNTAVIAAVGAMSGQAGIFLPLTALEMASTRKLNQGLKLLGDARNDIVCWVGNGITYADLVDQNIADNVQDLTGAVMYGGQPGTLGKPFIVTDSPALTNTGGGSTGDSYYILGLRSNGIVIEESENSSMVSDTILLKENVIGAMQYEGSYNVELAGMKWNTAVTNPTDAQLGTAGNWTKAVTSDKSLPGVIIEVDNKAA